MDDSSCLIGQDCSFVFPSNRLIERDELTMQTTAVPEKRGWRREEEDVEGGGGWRFHLLIPILLANPK